MKDYSRDGRVPQEPDYDVRDGMPGVDEPSKMDELRHAATSSYYKGRSVGGVRVGGADRGRIMRGGELMHGKCASGSRAYPYGYSGRHREQVRPDELQHGYHSKGGYAGYGYGIPAEGTMLGDMNDLDLDTVLDYFADHDLMDEIEVSNKYLDYACALMEDNQEELASQVSEMAYEEYTHARFQKHVLKEHGIAVDPEVLGAYSELKKRLEDLFQKGR